PFLDRRPELAAGRADGRGWPTLGGDPHRTGHVAGRFPRYWPGQPTWGKEIRNDKELRIDKDGRNPWKTQPHAPFGHPVIAGSRVYVSDGRRGLACGLAGGEEAPATA